MHTILKKTEYDHRTSVRLFAFWSDDNSKVCKNTVIAVVFKTQMRGVAALNTGTH